MSGAISMKARWFLMTFVATFALTLPPVAQADTSTYTVQLDAKPPAHEPWSYNRIFPGDVTVHQGDVIDAAWAGDEAPHTATFVPTTDPVAWRRDNQKIGDDYTFVEPDSFFGGDDGEQQMNPRALLPTSISCGDATTPCSFDGSSIVNSGFQFSDPSSEPSFFVRMDAGPGDYTFLCLVHRGMQIKVTVAAPESTIPSPADVQATAADQVAAATQTDGGRADEQAQSVAVRTLSHGRHLYRISAGGWSNGVSADEFLDHGLTMHVGDRLRVRGRPEIHTATFPASSDAIPLVLTECEQPGPDAPATSPADCGDPHRFEVVFNPTAVGPTSSTSLRDVNAFVNGGLITANGAVPDASGPAAVTFVALKPGTYTLVCIVHPGMTTKLRVKR
jgi:plastocyanin